MAGKFTGGTADPLFIFSVTSFGRERDRSSELEDPFRSLDVEFVAKWAKTMPRPTILLALPARQRDLERVARVKIESNVRIERKR